MTQSGPFTSRRELRLWLLAAGAVAAIFLSLAFSGALANRMKDLDVLGIAFGLGVFMIFAAIIAHGLRGEVSRREFGLGLGVAAVSVLILPRIASPAERTHLIEYSVVSLLVLEAMLERGVQGRPVPMCGFSAIVLTAFVGSIDEGIQYFLPSRVFDPADIFFNVLAAVMAIGARYGLLWARTKAQGGKAG